MSEVSDKFSGLKLGQTAFPCPCCGCVVFNKPPGSHEKCPVCYWEDDLPQLRFPEISGCNQVSLIVGQNNYQQLGASEERLKQYVRLPNSNEPVESGWHPIAKGSDNFENPQPGVDYSHTYPDDNTLLYYWRDNYWRRQNGDISEPDSHKGQNIELPSKPVELKIEFSGCAKEYFRIWIVNLCLSLLTLGIFSAWAKVRKKRYFYSQTKVDGTPFQYLGQPIPILKGRLIAATAFSVYYVSSHFFTPALPLVLVAGLIFVPWIIVRSAAFNARYSAFRNMTFHFDGKYQDALKVIYMGGFIPVVVAGMAFNWWTNLATKGLSVIVFLIYLVGLIFFPGWKRQIQAFIIGHTSYGSKNGALSATGGQFFKVYLKAWLLMFAVLFITTILGTILNAVINGSGSIISPLGLAFIFIPIYISYVLVYAYLQARRSNLVWTHTRMGPIRCQSTLSAWDMAKLYLTNTIAIVFSLGMLTPWAVVRMLKYRFEKLSVHLEGNLSEFQGSETSAVQAVGAEMQEFFDLDFSL